MRCLLPLLLRSLLASARMRSRARWSSTAATIPMPANSPRRRSSAKPASRRRSSASRPASSTRRSAPSAPIPRPTSGTAARSTRSCRRRPKACSSPTARRAWPNCSRGRAARPSASDYKVAAIYRIIIGFGTNPTVLKQKELVGAALLVGSRAAGLSQGDRALQSGHERHRLHDPRDAGHAVRRGRRVRLPEEAAAERRALHAVGHGAGTVGGARRSRRRRVASSTSSSRSSWPASQWTSRFRAKAPATRWAAWRSSMARRIRTRRAPSTTGR